MSSRNVWQGSLDMLCGIYCAVHLIAHYTVAGRPNLNNRKAIYNFAARSAFRNLMQSAEDLGLLKATKIANYNSGGYYDNEIEKIFNNLTPRKRYNLSALAFTNPKFKSLKNSERRTLVFDSGVSAIVSEHGGDHWIAVEGQHPDGGYACFDPQLSNNTSHRHRIKWERGLLIFMPSADRF